MQAHCRCPLNPIYTPSKHQVSSHRSCPSKIPHESVSVSFCIQKFPLHSVNWPESEKVSGPPEIFWCISMQSRQTMTRQEKHPESPTLCWAILILLLNIMGPFMCLHQQNILSPAFASGKLSRVCFRRHPSTCVPQQDVICYTWLSKETRSYCFSLVISPMKCILFCICMMKNVFLPSYYRPHSASVFMTCLSLSLQRLYFSTN